ncbi:MAG: SDR family oxidoreductase [Pseudomonadota bacterium]|nr:SDR family oxidoreductase [Pseudomonadota bacterium]
MPDFDNAIALITGAASGIGAAIATLLAEGGAKKLILADQDEDRLRDFAFSLPCERQMMIGDVADAGLWSQSDLTGLTHAVINAGVGAGGPIAETSFEDWRRVMAVNLDGAFLTLQAAMRAIGSGGQGGAIVLTASVAGLKAEPGIAAYGASKAAVIHLARIAAREGAASGIRVNSIAPGGVETPIWTALPFFQDLVRSTGSADGAFRAMGEMATPLRRYAKPEEIAEQVAFLLSDKAAYMTGACLVSDGGYSL